jgi:hypothetical protein
MKHLLLEAKHEIEALRRRNEILQAQVEVVEVFSVALLGPRPPQGMSIDVAWSLQKKINELDAKLATLAPDDMANDPAPLG